MEKTLKQRLAGPLCLFIFFIAMGVNSIIRGAESHQTWRIVLSVVSTLMFVVAVVIILIKMRKEKRAA